MTGRDRSILLAVSEGHGVLECGCEPHLLIDGRHVCDSDTYPLTHAGLIRPVVLGAVGERVRAELTLAGRAALEVAA